MNIKRKVIPIEINEKKYEFILDFESAIEFQELYGKSIFVGLSKLSEEQDLVAMACLIASALKDENGKPVGMQFVKQLDLMTSLELFMEKVTELVDNSIPKESKPVKKK